MPRPLVRAQRPTSGMTGQANSFTGDDTSNLLWAGAGDTVIANGGNDFVYMDSAPAYLDGGAGTDTAVYAATLPVLKDPGGRVAASEYHTTGYPETFVLDREGRLLEHVVGPAEWDSAERIAGFRRLLEASQREVNSRFAVYKQLAELKLPGASGNGGKN